MGQSHLVRCLGASTVVRVFRASDDREIPHEPSKLTVSLSIVDVVFDPPADLNEAVSLLLDRCPELSPVWEEQCRIAGESSAESIGIYVVFGQMILPLLLLILPGSDYRGSDEHDRADAQRRSMRNRPIWSRVPVDALGVADLLSRLYEVIDLWIASRSDELRDAAWSEMIDGGYADLTVEDLVAHGGPLLTWGISPDAKS